MTLKEYLESLNILSDNNDLILGFFEREDVSEFLKEKWKNVYDSEGIITEDVLQEEYFFPEEENISQQDIHDSDKELDTKPNNETMINSFFDNEMAHDKEQSITEAFINRVKAGQITLQNAKVGVEYASTIDLGFLSDLNIAEYWIEGLDQTGLSFDNETNTIKGIPILPGDFRLSLKLKREGWEEGKPVFERELTLIINPDPRSLWNNIPTPTDVPYYKPDEDKRFVKVATEKSLFGLIKKERKDMVAASKRGRSHAHEGKARDDDFRLSFDNDSEWYILTVADGAGSAKYSRRGSDLACQAVIDVCSIQLKHFDKMLNDLIKDYYKDNSESNRKQLGDKIYEMLGASAFKAYKVINEEAESSGNQVKDFSTTLIAAICKKFKFGWFIASFWVGDGGIGIYNKETGFLKVMGESDGGEFAGQTRFLTMPEIMKPEEIYRRLRFDIVDDFTALILMTDGITDPKFETDANLMKIEKWNALWEDLNKEVSFTDDNEETGEQLLKWLDFWSPGNHDDRTIAILF